MQNSNVLLANTVLKIFNTWWIKMLRNKSPVMDYCLSIFFSKYNLHSIWIWTNSFQYKDFAGEFIHLATICHCYYPSLATKKVWNHSSPQIMHWKVHHIWVETTSENIGNKLKGPISHLRRYSELDEAKTHHFVSLFWWRPKIFNQNSTSMEDTQSPSDSTPGCWQTPGNNKMFYKLTEYFKYRLRHRTLYEVWQYSNNLDLTVWIFVTCHEQFMCQLSFCLWQDSKLL